MLLCILKIHIKDILFISQRIKISLFSHFVRKSFRHKQPTPPNYKQTLRLVSRFGFQVKRQKHEHKILRIKLHLCFSVVTEFCLMPLNEPCLFRFLTMFGISKQIRMTGVRKVYDVSLFSHFNTVCVLCRRVTDRRTDRCPVRNYQRYIPHAHCNSVAR